MNTPYNEEDIGKSFIIIKAGRLSQNLARQGEKRNKDNTNVGGENNETRKNERIQISRCH
jgi:hypothetical protein